MNFTELFQKTVHELKNRKLKFALAGGMAASLYREHPRTTADLDFLIWTANAPEKNAKEIIEKFELKAASATKADLENGPMFAIKRRQGPVLIVVGRLPNDKDAPGLDFILPDMPWFYSALERAQTNLRDFGFGDIPCLSAEDIIISKFYSLSNDSSRTDDLSDLRSIFKTRQELDMVYISNQMRKMKILLPKAFSKEAPPILRKADKEIRREIRGG